MAIKERKQITGTEAQIKGYAGHNGVLAYATDTKHLHVLSGTAGTTTKLANMSDIPAPVDISGKADKTYVDTQLGTKATKTELTTGLAGKANTSHTHTIANVTGLQEAINSASTQASNAIPKSGNRGAIAGYEQWTRAGATTTLSVSSGDTLLMECGDKAATITVERSSAGQVATKLVWVFNSNKGSVEWFGDSAPTLNKDTAALLFFFHGGYTDCRLIGQWDEL